MRKSVQRIYLEGKGLGKKVSFFRASSWDNHLGGRVGGGGEGGSRIGLSGKLSFSAAIRKP